MTNDIFVAQCPQDKEADVAASFDPWALAELVDTSTPWKEKTTKQKFHTIFTVSLKVVFLIGLLYLFICSLDFLSNAFRLLGGKAAGDAFSNNAVMSNPVACMMAGILVTVLVQSSSTSTSIVVSMVASELLHVQPAIFVIMGTNIGTSVTNTIVAMGHAGHRDEFRRAFAGATVHDMFNWLSAICLLPFEWFTGSLGKWKGCGMMCQMTGAMTEGLKVQDGTNIEKEMIKVITKPFTNLFVQLDSKVLNDIATGAMKAADASLLKRYCGIPKGEDHEPHAKTCYYMFEHAVVVQGWSDAQVGACLLIMSLFLLCGCLALIVKLLHSLLKGKIAYLLRRVVNSKFPYPLGFLTGYFSILVGAGITMLLQSSSIFTSALTPLVGLGILHIKRMYPLTLGANMGTTFTAIMAAMAASRDQLAIAMQVALSHLFFNLFGIILWYPVPVMRRVPIKCAQGLGNTTAKYRWFAIVYLIAMYAFVPLLVFGLSMGGIGLLLGVMVPIIVVIVAILIINCLQTRKPSVLPFKLRSWDFLPKPLRSLQPYDSVFSKMYSCCLKDRKKDKDAKLHSCSSVDTNASDSARRELVSRSSTSSVGVGQDLDPSLGVRGAISSDQLYDEHPSVVDIEMATKE